MGKTRKYFGKKKRQKVKIEFDAEDRRDFLTGTYLIKFNHVYNLLISTLIP